MKRFLFLFTIIALYSSMAFAQNEVATDTLRQETGNIPPAEEQLLPDGTRNYGGFLIDMNSLIKMPTPDLSKSFKIVIPNASKDYSQLFRLNPDGSLTPINSMSAEGKSTCYVIVDPSGNFLYAANYSSSSFVEFRLKEGRIVERTQLIRHEGSGPNPARQEAAHPHFTGITSDGRYLAVIDLGIDAIKCYPLDPEKGLDAAHPVTSQIEPAGSGPRHLVYDRSGKIAYLLNELGNTVISMRYDDGKFEAIQSCTTLPRFVDCATKAAAIRLSPDENYLFASNRGYDSVAVYELDGKGGTFDYEYARPITIGDNVWLASNVVICGGVTIGDDCVIGAGSVVTKDIPARVFAAGNPCRVIRPLTEKDKMKLPCEE